MAAVLFISLALALFRSQGFYSPDDILLVTITALAAAIPWWRRDEDRFMPPPERWLAFILLSFLGALLHDPHVVYAVAFDVWQVQICIAAAFFAAVIATLRIFHDENEKPWLIAVLILLGAVKFLTLSISPFPRIDVFAYPTAAVRYFLSGKMVYSEAYRDIYQGEFAYQPGMVYPPGVLYFITPFYVWLRDIRAAFVVADLAGVLLISRIARALALPRRLGYWFAAVWAAFPVTLFITEQSWNEPLLIFLCGLLALSLIRERWVWAGVWLGCLLASKQYVIFLAAMTFAQVFFHRGKRAAIGMTVAAVLTCGLLLLPFLVSDPQGLYRSTIDSVAATPFRDDSFTLTAWLERRWLFEVTPLPRLFMYMAGLLGGVYLLSYDRSPRAWAQAVLFQYLIVFLLGSQGFCNYYYFVAFFALLTMIFQQADPFSKAHEPSGRGRLPKPGRSRPRFAVSWL